MHLCLCKSILTCAHPPLLLLLARQSTPVPHCYARNPSSAEGWLTDGSTATLSSTTAIRVETITDSLQAMI
jgi:hypothetical protein